MAKRIFDRQFMINWKKESNFKNKIYNKLKISRTFLMENIWFVTLKNITFNRKCTVNMKEKRNFKLILLITSNYES